MDFFLSQGIITGNEEEESQAGHFSFNNISDTKFDDEKKVNKNSKVTQVSNRLDDPNNQTNYKMKLYLKSLSKICAKS